MPNENPLQKFYYGLSDKSWAFAEWIEAKGLPLASFCDKYRLHPLLLLAVIAVVLILLVMLAAGALGGVSYSTLTVTVTSQGPLEGATVYYEFNGEVIENKTDQLGKAYIQFPKGPELAVSARKDGYNTNSQTLTLEEDTGAISISLDRKVGDLVVNIDVAGGKPVPSGAYVLVESSGEVAQTKPVVNNKATFEDLPDGITVTAYLAMGNQRIPPGGETAKIQEGATKEITISVPESALTVSLEVRVRDATYQNLDNVDVVLYDWNTGTPISSIETTYGGSVTFNGIVLGTSVYATVNPPSAQYGSYNGKLEGHKLDVTREGLVYEVTLAIVGQVRVCVYDASGAPLQTGTIVLRRASGASEASRSIADECEDFSGLPEGIAIYPEVNAPGYLTHANPSAAKTIDYSTITGFEVTMQPLAPDQQAAVFVHVEDCEGDPIDGIKVKIIDASTLSVLDEARTSCGGSVSFLPSCGNAEVRLEVGRDVYAVAFDDGYQLEKSGVETVGVNTVLDIIACEVSDDNVGAVKVCAYRDGDPFDGADLELYDSGGFLRWTATTDDDEEDPDHCHTFINIPAGTTVYAKAINLGTSPEVSGTMEIVGGETGELSVYTGSAPVVLDEGDVEVCVKEAETGLSMTANVTLYDLITQQAIIAGETAGAGCRLFEGLTAETNSGGRIVPKEIYLGVAKEGYGTYNSKDDGIVLEMVPNGKLTINVNLSEAFEICVQVRASDDNRALRADVVLYYNETADYPIKKVKTGGNGVAKFYQAQRDVYYFKLLEKYTLYDPKGVYELEKDEVSGGNCGKLMLYDLGTLCNLGIVLLAGDDNLTVIAEQKLELPIRVLEGGRRGDTSVTDEGKTANKFQIQLKSGEEANLTLKLNNKFQSMTLVYGSTKFSSEQEMIAGLTIDKVGMYSGLVEVKKNPYCSRQSAFNLKVYKEQLFVSADSVEFNPLEEKSKSFCIYVTDQDEEPVTDASLTIQVDEMDGWKTTATRTASYDEIKECYRGVIVSSMAPDEGGTYPLNILVKRGNIKKLHQAEVDIITASPCGNGVVDSGEECDPGAYPSTCGDGYECSYECNCVEETVESGTLRVSADTVKISIGSGRSSGFCVEVSDDQGEVTDAQVSANLYGNEGWPQDVSLKASYDVAKGCYYVPMSESVAWPRGVRMVGKIDDLMDSKTIAIAAVQGDRSAATTTTASFECGCDEERWCEWTCPCDEDCEEGGGGNFNLFNCLILLNQQGYYPQSMPYPMSYPYPMSRTGRASYPAQAYGSQNYRPGGYAPGYPGAAPGGVGMTPGGMQAGGISLANGGITLGGGGTSLTLNLEQCKKMFGLGGDDADRIGNGYVLVRDELGLIDGDRDSGTCKTLLDSLEATGKAKYVHVQNQANTCCTKTFGGGIFSSGKCSLNEFVKLMNSALAKNEPTTEIVIDRLTTSNLGPYGLSNYKIFGSGAESVLYNGDSLFGSGAVVAAKVASATRTKEKYVWGLLLDDASLSGTAAAPSSGSSGTTGAAGPSYTWQKTFDFAWPVWREAIRGATITKYSPSATEPQKTIVVADAQPVNLPGSFLNGDEQGLQEAMFSRLGEGTKLYVIADYTSLKANSNVLGELAKKLDGQGIVKFEEVRESEFNYCHAGRFTKYQNPPSGGSQSSGKKMTLLRASSQLFLGGGDSICEYPNPQTDGTDHALDLKNFNADALKDIAYGKMSRGRAGTSYLLMAGRQTNIGKFVPPFLKSPPSGGATKIYTLSKGKYVAIRAACHKEQLCTTKKSLDKMREILKSNIDTDSLHIYPADDIEDNLVPCVCGGQPDNPPARIKVTIKYSKLLYFLPYAPMKPNTVQPSDFQLYKVVGVKVETITLPDDTKADDSKFTFVIRDIPVEGPEIQLRAGFEKTGPITVANKKKTGRACFATNLLKIDRSKLTPGGEYPATLTLDEKWGCIPRDYLKSQGIYTITGEVVDALGTAVARATLEISSDDSGTFPLSAPPNSDWKTDSNGKIKAGVSARPGDHPYVRAVLGDEKTELVKIVGVLPSLRMGASGSSAAAAILNPGSASTTYQKGVTLEDKLKFKNLYQLGFKGILKGKNGKPISGATVSLVAEGGTIVGTPMESVKTKADGKYKIVGKVKQGTYLFKVGEAANLQPAYAEKECTNELGLKVEGDKVFKLVGGNPPLSGNKESDSIGSSKVNYMRYTLDMYARSGGATAGTTPTGATVLCSDLVIPAPTRGSVPSQWRVRLTAKCWQTPALALTAAPSISIHRGTTLKGTGTCSIGVAGPPTTLTCQVDITLPTTGSHTLKVRIDGAKLASNPTRDAEATTTINTATGTSSGSSSGGTARGDNMGSRDMVYINLGEEIEIQDHCRLKFDKAEQTGHLGDFARTRTYTLTFKIMDKDGNIPTGISNAGYTISGLVGDNRPMSDKSTTTGQILCNPPSGARHRFRISVQGFNRYRPDNRARISFSVISPP